MEFQVEYRSKKPSWTYLSGSCIYRTAEEMENERSRIEKVMGDKTDFTLEWFKKLAEKTNRFFEHDFQEFLEKGLKIPFTKLHPSSVIVLSDSFCY